MRNRPPPLVSILGRPFRFRYRTPKSMGEAAGLCHQADGVIDILRGQRPFDEADTVLHEVLHAIRYCQGRENGGEVEEDYVRSLATGLIGVLQDNPEFAQWLCSPHKDPPP
jgi:hypothetical protein